MLKLQPAVKQDTLRIAAGTACLACVMMLVFLMIGRFDLTVLLGTLLGSATAVGNFFFMALTIQKAVESMKDAPAPAPQEPADPDDPDGEPADAPPSALSQAARQRVQLSYSLRMLAIIAVGIIALTVDVFHPIATLLPLLFPRIVIFVLGKITKPEETEG